MTRLEEIVARMAAILPDIETLGALPGDLDDAQRSDWDALNGEWDTLDAEKTAIEGRNTRLAALRSVALTDVTRTEHGDGATAPNVIVKPVESDLFDRSGLNVENRGDDRQWRDRALRAIESWGDEYQLKPELLEGAERTLRTGGQSSTERNIIARHILATGSPDYFRAFCTVIANPVLGAAALDTNEAQAMRAAMAEGTTTTGGFAVPPMLDPTLILTNAGVSNPFRQISTVKTIATQTWKGLTSAGVTAEWTSEAAEATDASPTLGQPSITPVRADAYVQASFEMIEDTGIASDLAMLFADARDRLEGAAFATGTGSTQPFGIVTELGLVTASRVAVQTNASFGAIDLFAADNSMSQRFRANASWVANKSIYNLVRQFTVSSSPQAGNFWVDLGGGRPGRLIGYDAYESSAMQSSLSTATASTDNIAILGDFKTGFYIVDRIGMSVAYNPLVIGSNRRPTGEVGWFAFWRVGSRAVVPDAFRMLVA